MSTTTSPYGDEIKAGASGTKVLINISYRDGAPYQWAYELFRNYVQACDRAETLRGDERMEFDFTALPWKLFGAKRGADGPKTVKRRIWNSGPPMSPQDELVPYFTSLGEGGGANRFSTENTAGSYGKGSRAAILPHSDMLIITTQPGGKSHALGILNTPTAYCQALFHSYDGEGDGPAEAVQLVELDQSFYLEKDAYSLEMTTAALVHPEVADKGGVTLIMLGREWFKDYTNGDVRKGESARQLQDKLTSRIHSDYPVHAASLFANTPESRADKRVRGSVIGGKATDRRKLLTYHDWTARAVHKGTVMLDERGTSVEWFLLPDGWNLTGSFKDEEAAKKAKGSGTARLRENGTWGITNSKDSWLPWDGKGFLVAQYGYEMIPLYPNKGAVEALKEWGINHSSIADRVGLIVHAPEQKNFTDWGVTQNESRSSLTGPNGTALPLSDWATAWYENVPQEILDALRAMKPITNRMIDAKDVERLRSVIRSRSADVRQQIEVLVEGGKSDAEGEGVVVNVTPDHNGNGGVIVDPAPREPHEVAKQGGKRKSNPRQMSALPVPEFISADAWSERGFDPKHFCVVENGALQMDIYLNEGHSIYTSQAAYYGLSGEFFKTRPTLRRKVTLAAALEAVQVAYQTEALAKVLWIMDDIKPMRQDKLAQRTAPQCMTDALSGYFNVDGRIQTRIGGSAR